MNNIPILRWTMFKTVQNRLNSLSSFIYTTISLPNMCLDRFPDYRYQNKRPRHNLTLKVMIEMQIGQ